MMRRLDARTVPFKSFVTCIGLGGLVAACGLTKPQGTEETVNPNLRATAEKASNLSALEQQAYTRNTLLKFSEADKN